jgi:hypothetical protein
VNFTAFSIMQVLIFFRPAHLNLLEIFGSNPERPFRLGGGFLNLPCDPLLAKSKEAIIVSMIQLFLRLP